MPVKPPTGTFPDAKNKVIRLSDVYFQLSRSLIQIRDELFSFYRSAEEGGFWKTPANPVAFPWDAQDAFNAAAHVLEADFANLDETKNWTGHIYTASQPFRIDVQMRTGGPFYKHEIALLDGLRNNLYSLALGQNKERKLGVWKASTGKLRDKRYLRVPLR